MLDDGGHLLEVFLQCGDQLVPARRPGRGRGIAARLGRLAAVAAAFTLGGAAVHVLLLRRRRGPVVGQPFDDEGLPREVSQQGRSGGHRPEAQTGDEGLQSVAQGQHNISLQELVRANLHCPTVHTSNHKLLDAALGTPLGFSSGPRSCLKSSPIATRNGEASPSRAWRPSESAAKPSNSLQGPCTTTARAPPRHQAVRPARGSESLARSPNCNTTRPSKSARLDSTWASSASWRSTKAVSGKSSTDARSASWS
mmetsp:Transcript_40248/g.129324  ORF Transcript_40248/g.129324 Transcript_40248/m.129324 type:complete len:254 (-) Transcript_40248:300-1061(-)